MKWKTLKAISFSPNGIKVNHYPKGEILEDPDPELVRIFTEDTETPQIEAVACDGTGGDELIVNYEKKVMSSGDNVPPFSEVSDYFTEKGKDQEAARAFIASTIWENIKSWKHAAGNYMKK